MKKLTTILLALLAISSLQAQVKIGENPKDINDSSILEMETTNKGMLLPRVALQETTKFEPLAAHVAGMTVYNTATAGDVTPGYYYNDGTKWVRIADANATDATKDAWVDEDAENRVSLNYASLKDSIYYTANGYKQYYKNISDDLEWFNENSLSYDPITLDQLDAYNSVRLQTSNFTPSANPYDPTKKRIYMDLNSVRIDKNDVNNAYDYFLHASTGSIHRSNGKNYSKVFINMFAGSHQGTGKLRQLHGNYVTTSNARGKGKITNLYGTFNNQTSRGSITPTNINANYNRVNIASTGDISNIYVTRSLVRQLDEVEFATASSNVKNLYMFHADHKGLGANYSGSIKNFYDFYASDKSSNLGGTITNYYGLYLKGLNKVNYVAGRLGVGTTKHNGSSENKSPKATIDAAEGSARFANRYYKYKNYPSVGAAEWRMIDVRDGARYGEPDENALEAGRVYRVTLGNESSVGTGAVYMVYQNMGEWTAKQVANTTSTATLLLRVAASGNQLEVSHTHSTNAYAIRVNIESFRSGNANNGLAAPILGLDSEISVLDKNIGIGTETPTQKLEVTGSVKVGNGGDTATPGTIRYNAETDKFQGYTKSSGWVDLH